MKSVPIQIVNEGRGDSFDDGFQSSDLSRRAGMFKPHRIYLYYGPLYLSCSDVLLNMNRTAYKWDGGVEKTIPPKIAMCQLYDYQTP